MNRLSLRMRLTLVTVSVLAAICVITTMFTVAGVHVFMSPVSINLDQIGQSAQTVAGLASQIYISEEFMITVSNEGGDFVPRQFLTAPTEQYVSAVIDSVEVAPAYPANAENLEYTIHTLEETKQKSAALAGETATVAVAVERASYGFSKTALIVMAVMILAGGVAVYFTSGFALRPVRELSHEIRSIGEGELSHRVREGSGADEINALASSFNAMLSRLEQAFSAQKRFSTAAAHELKTPLAAIRANVDVLSLEAQPSREDYAQLVEVVSRQTERMRLLVDDLFAMSALREYVQEEEIEISEMLRELTDESLFSAQEKNISLELSAQSAIVSGNAVMLGRAAANVIENAINYTPRGGSVSVCAGVIGSTVQISVSDDGSGISEEHLPHIFEPFYRADASRSREGGGAGLGLALASEIVSAHSGTLSVKNLEAGGCEFVFTLPLKEK